MRSLALIFFILCPLCFGQPTEGYARTTENGRGAVASVHPLATQAGLDAFEKGGNAIDAAIAVAFTLGVVDGHNSGIGGGCLMLLHQADGTVWAIDGRDMAPALSSRDMFIRDGEAVPELSQTGPLAIAIPGSVAAFHFAQKNVGKLSFDEVILPAADIAEGGFKIDRVYAERLATHAEVMRSYPSTAGIFLKDRTLPYLEGETLIQKDLANTYRTLANKGPAYFYTGEFPKAVEQWVTNHGGIVRAKDFANYQLQLRTPIVTMFKDLRVIGFPPPSSGGTMVAEILNILENFDLHTLDQVDRYHVTIEAMKLAFADRAHWLGDPDLVKIPKGLVSKNYATSLADNISMDRATKVASHGTPPDAATFGRHTTHIATADKEGNWVAITTTLNTSFGSKVVIPGTGVLMNNQMDDFSTNPGVPNAYGLVGGEANRIEPRKRPLSSMSPTIVTQNGRPILTLGAAGGGTIISQVVQTIINHLVLDLPLDQAIGAVRVHQQWQPESVLIDTSASSELKSGLEAKRHKLLAWPPFGATQAIGLIDGRFYPVSEPRVISKNR